jgi:drug/metabolite transporter (DMT)-like permease
MSVPRSIASWVPWSLLGVGVVAASAGAILVRYAAGAEPLAIAFWRCAAGAAMLAPLAAPRIRTGSRTAFALTVLAGAFLAAHFATWITSLGLTTVAASVLLVSTTPVFVGLIEWLRGERLPCRTWAGIGLAIAGSALVAGGDLGTLVAGNDSGALVAGGDLGASPLAGNALALLGGACAAGYVLAGQRARRTLGTFEYAAATYATAAALLGLACLLGSVPLGGYPAPTWWALAGMVAGPQLLGHTVINRVLRDLRAAAVATALLAEPVIAVALAYLLLGEVPAPLAYPGGAAILLGIYLVARPRP